jgi:hypothetical protein
MASLIEIHEYYRNKSVDEIIAMLEKQLPPESQDLVFREMWRDVLTEISFINLRPRIETDADYVKPKYNEILRWLYFVVSAIAPYWFPNAEKMTRYVTYTNLARSEWLVGALLFGDYELFTIGLKNSPSALSMKMNIRFELTADQSKIITHLRTGCKSANDNAVKRAEERFSSDLLLILRQQLELLETDHKSQSEAIQPLNSRIHTHPIMEPKFWDDIIVIIYWISPIVLFLTFMGILDKLGILDEFLGIKIVFFERILLGVAIFDFILALLVYILGKISNDAYNWKEDVEKETSAN